MPILEKALSLAGIAGWYVFPMPPKGAVDEQGKPYSYYPFSWLRDATNSVAEIKRNHRKANSVWFTDDNQRIGVYTGASNIVVVDLDQKNGKNGLKSLKAAGKKLPNTLNYTSQSGSGKHYVYAANPDKVLTIAADLNNMAGVDIRAGRGVAVYNGPILTDNPNLAPVPSWAQVERVERDHESVNLEEWLAAENGSTMIKGFKATIESRIPLDGLGNAGLLKAITPLVTMCTWLPGRNEAFKYALERYTAHHPTADKAFIKAWTAAIARVEADLTALFNEPPSQPGPGVVAYRDPVIDGKNLGTQHKVGSLVFTSLETAVIRSAEWVWGGEGIGGVPVGALTIITGKPGDGKSTLCRWLAAELSKGTLPGTWEGSPVGVLYLSAEESLDHVLTPSLRANGADMSKVYVPQVSLNPNEDMDDVIQFCKTNGIRAVFVDPLTSFMGGVDTHKNSDVREALKAWSRLAEEIDGAVIAIVHQIKSGGSDFVSSINGSSAYGEVARAIFATAVDHETGIRVLSQGKNSLGPYAPSREYKLVSKSLPTIDGKLKTSPKFILGKETSLKAGDIYNKNKRLDQGETVTAKSWLKDYLTNNPGAFKMDVIKAGDYSERSIEQASKELKVTKTYKDRRVTWTLE